MDKTIIGFGIAIIFFLSVSIICAIRLIVINCKIKELTWIQILLDQAKRTLDNSDLILKANDKIINFKKNNMNLDLSLLDDAFELNLKVVDSVNCNVKNLHKFIHEYQEGEKLWMSKNIIIIWNY